MRNVWSDMKDEADREQRARMSTHSDARLLASWYLKRAGVYVTAELEEAAKRILADQPAATVLHLETASACNCTAQLYSSRDHAESCPMAMAAPQGAGMAEAWVNGHQFQYQVNVSSLEHANCDKCGLQYGARLTRACEVVK